MPEAERPQRQPGTVIGRVGERGLRAAVVLTEIGPPQAGGERESEHGDARDRSVERQEAGADPDRDHRFADRDQDDQPVALDEVSGLDLEPEFRSS